MESILRNQRVRNLHDGPAAESEPGPPVERVPGSLGFEDRRGLSPGKGFGGPFQHLADVGMTGGCGKLTLAASATLGQFASPARRRAQR
jgi:hypothetical protein